MLLFKKQQTKFTKKLQTINCLCFLVPISKQVDVPWCDNKTGYNIIERQEKENDNSLLKNEHRIFSRKESVYNRWMVQSVYSQQNSYALLKLPVFNVPHKSIWHHNRDLGVSLCQLHNRLDILLGLKYALLVYPPFCVFVIECLNFYKIIIINK